MSVHATRYPPQVFLRLAVWLAAGALLAACVTQEYTYKYYRGPARPEAEVATIALANAVAVRINGQEVNYRDYTHVVLLSGHYRLGWRCLSIVHRGVFDEFEHPEVEVQLVPGHRYSLRCARTTGEGSRTFQWVWDDTESRLVAGKNKP